MTMELTIIENAQENHSFNYLFMVIDFGQTTWHVNTIPYSLHVASSFIFSGKETRV